MIRTRTLVAGTVILVASTATAVPPPPPPSPPPGASSAPPTDASSSSTAPTIEPIAITAPPPDTAVAVQTVVVARPSDRERAPAQPSDPHRIWGFGTALGGGFSAGILPSPYGTTFVTPALVLPTIETRAFTRNGFSFDISIPIANAVFTSIAYRGFGWSSDFFFNFNVGTGRFRLLVGPGIGFSVLAANYAGMSISSGSFRIPSEVGFEVLTDARGFGFQLIARPWLEFGAASSATSSVSAVSAVGTGMLFMIGFFGYSATR